MPKSDNLNTALKIANSNPYTGDTKQIVNLALSISKTLRTLDSSTISVYKQEINIAPEIFSKLKIIGEKLLRLPDNKLQDIIKTLPASYHAIHALCSLSPEELFTASKSKILSPVMSVRQARAVVKKIKFPTKAILDGEQGQWGTKHTYLFNVVTGEHQNLPGEKVNQLKEELNKVCLEYGVHLQESNPSGVSTLRKQERNEKGLFWKTMLMKQTSQEWFDTTSEDVRKQFNIRTLQELIEAPIRTFTGFIIKASGSRDIFWKEYGYAYIAKLEMLGAVTEDASQRYNYKRRLEKVMSERKTLAIWRNKILQDSGLL